MSRKHKIRDQQKLYFVTFTVIHWIDVFVRNVYKRCFVNSVKYCQKEKGLGIYAWRNMISHVHINPVVAGFVDGSEAWLYNSAGNYVLGQKGIIELKWIE